MSKDTTLAGKVYDLTPIQREALEYRHKKRITLRNEYLKEIHNPINNVDGYLFDSQLQRHYTAIFAREKLFKPKFGNFCSYIFGTFGLIGLVAWRVKKFRNEKENKIRTGQVSYRDRHSKFV